MITSKLESKQKSILSVPDSYQTTAIFLTPLISHCTLPLTCYIVPDLISWMYLSPQPSSITLTASCNGMGSWLILILIISEVGVTTIALYTVQHVKLRPKNGRTYIYDLVENGCVAIKLLFWKKAFYFVHVKI